MNLATRLQPNETDNAAAAAAIDTDFARDLAAGLAARPKSVAPKHFYDAAGSALFDRICELPEYYPTRTELALLDRHAPRIATLVGPEAEIVEFGAGSATKIRVLLDALVAPRRFVPIDISADHLRAAAAQLQHDYRGLDVQPVAADFTQAFDLPAPHGAKPARRIGFFPGSSIGNFAPDEALAFLRQAARLLEGGAMLVGVDLIKDPAVLHAAYNDAAGVTAAFNRNLLVRANREMGCDFATEQYAHYAFYDPRLARVEMHLVSRRAQEVRLAGRTYAFAEGESLHTENSHKFTVDSFQALARRAGFEPVEAWCDTQRRFSLHWLVAPEGARA